MEYTAKEYTTDSQLMFAASACPQDTTDMDSAPSVSNPLSQATLTKDENNSGSNKDLVYILFIGNPGVGKSTLLNCLVNQRKQENAEQKIIFESGISFNTGMTKELHTAEIDGHVYMDTPGLEDTKIRKLAAEAITEALKKGGRYQVVFVVTLEAGRVRPSDITTMNLVLDSAKDISQYGVIFNKIGKRIFREKTDENKVELTSQISLCPLEHKPVPLPFFVQKSNDLDDESNATADIDELDDFVNSIIPIHVNEESVTQIPIESYEKMKEKIENDLEFLKSNNEEMRKKMKEDAMTYQAKIADVIAKAEEEYEMKKEKLLQDQEKEYSMMTKELEEIETLKKMREANQDSPFKAKQTDGMPEENEFKPCSNKRKFANEWMEKPGFSHKFLQDNEEVYPYGGKRNEMPYAYHHSNNDEILQKREAELKENLRKLENQKADLENERRRIKAAKKRNNSSSLQKFCQVVEDVVSSFFR